MSWPGLVLGIFDRLFSRDAKRTRQRKETLNRLLDDRSVARSGIRSLETLAMKTGMSPEDCRALLAEIGCEGVTMADGREGWRKRDNG